MYHILPQVFRWHNMHMILWLEIILISLGIVGKYCIVLWEIFMGFNFHGWLIFTISWVDALTPIMYCTIELIFLEPLKNFPLYVIYCLHWNCFCPNALILCSPIITHFFIDSIVCFSTRISPCRYVFVSLIVWLCCPLWRLDLTHWSCDWCVGHDLWPWLATDINWFDCCWFLGRMSVASYDYLSPPSIHLHTCIMGKFSREKTHQFRNLKATYKSFLHKVLGVPHWPVQLV